MQYIPKLLERFKYKPKKIKISKENFQVMQPILAVSRIFGLCPISYKKCGHFYELQRSVFFEIYSYILSAVLAIGAISSIILGKSAIGGKLAEWDTKSKYISAVDIISTTTIVIFCVFATPYKLKSLWKICESFTEIEKNHAFDKISIYRKKSIYFISSVLALYTIIFLYDNMAWHIKLGRSDKLAIFFKEYLPLNLSRYMLITQILFFCQLIYFTKIRLICLNKVLLENSNSISDQSEVSEVYTLFGLANNQRKIFEVVGIINDTFAFGVILIMLNCLLHLTVTPYFLLNEIEKKDSMFFVCLQTVWLIAHLGKLCIIIESCKQCVREGDRTVYTVQKFFSRNIQEPVRFVLNIFVMQLDTCRIEFNICGLFRMEKSFISIAAAITTYLVVLLQIKN